MKSVYLVLAPQTINSRVALNVGDEVDLIGVNSMYPNSRDVMKDGRTYVVPETELKQKWVCPEWMEKYRQYSTYGDRWEDLMNDVWTTPYNNSILYSIITVTTTDITMLMRLHVAKIIQ